MLPAKKKKILIAVSSTLILSSIIIILSFLNQLPKKRFGEIFQVGGQPGSLSLNVNPATVEVGGNQTTTCEVALDTGGEQVAGVDSVITFDSSKLEVSGFQGSTNTTFKTFAPIVSETDRSLDFSKAVKINTNPSQSTFEFGALTFDFDPNGDGDTADAAPTQPFTGNTPLASVNFTAKPLRQTTFLSLVPQMQANQTTDSNIAEATQGNDILGTVSQTTLKIKAQPVCRAAVNLADQVANLNDLVQIVNKGWDSNCPDCLEDLNEDSRVNLGDLVFVVNYWDQTCPVSQ